MDKILSEYCCGCMLCSSVGEATLNKDAKGFYHPQFGDEEFLTSVCPCYGNQLTQMDPSQIWGKHIAVYYGWSSNNEVRYSASSGGVLTQIACYLLETKKVDYIIQTSVDADEQTKTVTKISSTVDEVEDCCGSRYSISNPLDVIGNLDLSKTYAFIGKPCDVTVLRNYIKIKPQVGKSIKYILSFFCAGLPSEKAQDELLRQLNVSKGDLKRLQYRGNGWPGYATAIDKNDGIHSMDYNSSWGKILGRDVMKACRFCLDGIGELADISCGDAWYLTSDNRPNFTEAEGRNIVFARTQCGDELLKEISSKGLIELPSANLNELRYSQTFQLERRASMAAKLLALKIMRHPVPKFNKVSIKLYKKEIAFKRRAKLFLGTIKRVMQGKI